MMSEIKSTNIDVEYDLLKLGCELILYGLDPLMVDTIIETEILKLVNNETDDYLNENLIKMSIARRSILMIQQHQIKLSMFVFLRLCSVETNSFICKKLDKYL